MGSDKREVISRMYLDAKGNPVPAESPDAVVGEETIRLPDGTEIRQYLVKPKK